MNIPLTPLYAGPTPDDLARIPGALKAVRQWVLWEGVWRPSPPAPGQKMTKIPIDPRTLMAADVTDPFTWGTYDECLEALPVALEEWQTEDQSVFCGGGVGFVFTADDPYVGVDLDGCVDPVTGVIADWPHTIVKQFASYAEISPSATGVHIICEGTLPPRGRRKDAVEMYDRARFFTMTGWRLEPSPCTVNPATVPLHTLWGQLFGAQVGDPVWLVNDSGVIANGQPWIIQHIGPAPNGAPYAFFAETSSGWPLVGCERAPAVPAQEASLTLEDGEVVQRVINARNAAKVIALVRGDWARDYPSQSEADLALCCHLAFWTRDAAQIDRLFRQTGLMRDKWDAPRGAQTYGQRTIAEALARQVEHYIQPATFIVPGAESRNGTTSAQVWGSQPSTAAIATEPWTQPPQLPWPRLDDQAYYGLAGAIVQTLAPQTESDPVALLMQLLVMVGNAIGHGPHFQVEATLHHMNLFAAMVGATSKSRKGTSAAHGRRILRTIDRAWSLLVKGGLSSGEGLIWHVRDAVWGYNKRNEEICLDEGVEDKRLCVLEEEFARALTKKGIEGNVLSHVLREAWDHGDLHTLVSGRHKATVHASGAHISVIGHITLAELRRLITDVDATNGFANRFLWVCVKRSRLLPGGGKYPEKALQPLRQELEKTIEIAKNIERMERNDKAEARWQALYATLATEHPGLLGELTARAEAQVLRLSCLYALLDKTKTIDVPHLEAAAALWDYCAASARYIFGTILGDPVADDIFLVLQDVAPVGLTRTEISNALGRHVSSVAIRRSLLALHDARMARAIVEKTAGRSSERWFFCTPEELAN